MNTTTTDTSKLPVKTLTAEDFSWTTWGVKDIKPLAKLAAATLKADHDRIKKIPKADRTFQNTVEALENSGEEVGQRVEYAKFLMEVSPKKEVREAAKKMIDEYSPLIVDIAYDEGVYIALKEYIAKKEKLSGIQKRLLDDMVRGYRRMGFELPKGKRDQLKKNIKLLNKLGLQFRKNINDYEDYITLTKEEAAGLSDRFLSGLKKDKKGRYIVTLEYPDIGPFIENSPNDKKRKEITDKNTQKGGKKNLIILEKIIELRNENAKLLGYKNHAEYVLEERMAKKPETVNSFINDLIKKLSKSSKAELDELTSFKREFTNDKKATFTYYDGYYANQLQKQKYNVDNEKVREYFPFEVVRKGIFEIYQKLLGVTFKRLTGFPTWHEDVEVYAVIDGGKEIAYFLMDLFPREGKYGHACAADIVYGGAYMEDGRQLYRAPVACLVTNFSKPTRETPSLLTHSEVETFFHEFGHIMHHTLSKAYYVSQAGFHVAWDFVEVPSQMLENWVWNKETLKKISGHYRNPGEKLPDEMLSNMLAAKNFMSSRMYMRQMTLSLFDFLIHSKSQKKSLPKVYQSLVKKYVGGDIAKDSLFPANFGHIAGGYDAGYYSYAWSKVYAQDLFSRFEKEGLFNEKTGADYRKWILEKGSSMDEMDLIKGFLGRKPNNKAFLKDIGVIK